MSSCAIKNCPEVGSFQCSRCKRVHYCSLGHQKLDWKQHRSVCNESKSICHDKAGDNRSQEMRTCRCMFCGEQITICSEEQAVEHMRVCSSLQEQLASKEQFTVPKVVKEKMKSGLV
jgi:hypothetical protein